MTTDAAPVDLNCFRSVSIPAENIMKITPIFARKEMPSIAVALNIVCPGINLISPRSMPASNIPTTCGSPSFLNRIDINLDKSSMSASGNKIS